MGAALGLARQASKRLRAYARHEMPPGIQASDESQQVRVTGQCRFCESQTCKFECASYLTSVIMSRFTLHDLYGLRRMHPDLFCRMEAGRSAEVVACCTSKLSSLTSIYVKAVCPCIQPFCTHSLKPCALFMKAVAFCWSAST